MGKQYTRVTAEMVRTARQYKDDPRKFTKAEIAAMSGTSLTTLSRILNGEYDYLLAPVEPVNTDGKTTVIPFSEIRHRMACENVVKITIRDSRPKRSGCNKIICTYKSGTQSIRVVRAPGS